MAQAWAFSSPIIHWCPASRKLNLEKIRAALNITPHRNSSIPPDKQVRVDFEHLRCPGCGQTFVPEKKVQEILK